MGRSLGLKVAGVRLTEAKNVEFRVSVPHRSLVYPASSLKHLGIVFLLELRVV